MSYNIQAKIMTGYLCIILCLGASLLIVNDRMTGLQNEVEFISKHDIELHDLINQVQKNILDMETGMRGYVITGDDQYLEPYEAGSRSWPDNYNKLHTLLADNPEQQRNLEQIKPLIASWISNTGEYVITLKKENNEAAVNRHFEQNTGKKIMDQLRTQFDSFLADEKKLTSDRIANLTQSNTNVKIVLYTIVGIVSLLTLAVALILSRSIVRTIKQVVRTIRSIADSEVDLTARIELNTRDEIRDLAEATNRLLGSLEKQNWVQKNMTDISTMYQGVTDIAALTQAFVTKLAPMLEAVYGVVYLRRTIGGQEVYVKTAAYAASGEEKGALSFRPGEGLVGQCALDKRLFLIDSLPEGHIAITSGLGASSPRSLLIAPILVDDRVEAVVEFAALQPFVSQHLTLLDQLQEKFGSAITNVLGRMEVERLLAESQMMTEELQAQSEELQAQAEELQMQQEQLRITNEHLEEQNLNVEQRALELKKAKDELEAYSVKLQTSSQYKTDFLANMSHELRTPLNSILILSQMLVETGAEMETAEVEEYSRVVNTAGQDLLRLINDILDLSKIEAGKIDIVTDEVNVTELPQIMKSLFGPVAARKDLDFEVLLHPEAPKVIATDGQRLQQILNNLLSNAFKFTERGSVTVRIEPAKPERIKELLPVQEDEAVIAISVTDTGIGIPIDKQQLIFEAFRQVDGTTNRQYGGTGLGLSICREFTRLLGGSIVVRSELHKGSTFTLYIPSRRETDSQGGTMADEASAASFAEVAVTRDSQEEASHAQENEEEDGVGSDVQLFKGKKVLLVDDDSRNVFALVSALEKKGVSVMAAEHGKRALEILEEQPGFDLVLMDIMMPVMDGYETMEAIRHRLGLTKLPIIALTAKAMKNEREKCREAGASDYIMKPLNIDQLFSLMRVWLTKQVNPF